MRPLVINMNTGGGIKANTSNRKEDEEEEEAFPDPMTQGDLTVAELAKYNARAGTIPDKAQRVDGKGTDSYDFFKWWRAAKDELPATFQLLRAVLVYSPNSCPPERVFSILNDSFDDDQHQSYADYMEYSLMRQYNARGRV